MQVWIYTLIPAAAAIIGAAAALALRPGPTVVSAIQHFAGGVVFAAAAGEILPDVKHEGSIWPVAIGGGVGILVMLLVKQIETWSKGPLALAATIAIDIFIDGLVLGIGFATGAKAGILLTIALTIEVLFLGLTIANELGEFATSRLKVVALTAAIVVLLPIGAFVGAPVVSLPKPFLTGFFAFSLIALLYLVTEELLVEAHETPDRPWVTAMFFVGFLLLLILEQAIG